MTTNSIHATWLTLAVAACGTDGGSEPPIETAGLSALEACVLDGGTFAETRATSNRRGAITALAVSGTTAMLASEDGSVKQWQLGEEVSYGATFADEGPTVGALAVGSDGTLFGADRAGSLHEWRRADASPLRSTPIAEIGFGAIAVSEQADRVAISSGIDAADIRIFDRNTGAIEGPLATELWGVSSLAIGHGGMLITAGHWYSTPMVERRDLSSPGTVIDRWGDDTMQANVLAAALDPYALRVIAVGDGFVAVLDTNALPAGPIAITHAPEHEAIGVALLPGGELFATAGREGTVKLWKLATAELVDSVAVPSPIDIAIDGDGAQVFTAGSDGFVRVLGCR